MRNSLPAAFRAGKPLCAAAIAVRQARSDFLDGVLRGLLRRGSQGRQRGDSFGYAGPCSLRPDLEGGLRGAIGFGTPHGLLTGSEHSVNPVGRASRHCMRLVCRSPCPNANGVASYSPGLGQPWGRGATRPRPQPQRGCVNGKQRPEHPRLVDEPYGRRGDVDATLSGLVIRAAPRFPGLCEPWAIWLYPFGVHSAPARLQPDVVPALGLLPLRTAGPFWGSAP